MKVYEHMAEEVEVKERVDKPLEVLEMVFEDKVLEEEDLVVENKEEGKVGHRAEAGDAGTSAIEVVVVVVVDNIPQEEEVLEEDLDPDTTLQNS